MPESSAARLARLLPRLEKAYGRPPAEEPKPILEQLIYAILSEGRTLGRAPRAWRVLFQAFADLNELRLATPAQVARPIEGLEDATAKAVTVRRLLQVIVDEFEEVSLDLWKDLSVAELKRRLLLLPGVNSHHAASVVTVSRGEPAVFLSEDQLRLLRRLRVFAKDASPTRMQDGITRAFPERARYAFQKLLQAHARAICQPEPRCPSCVLKDLCPSRQEPVLAKASAGEAS